MKMHLFFTLIVSILADFIGLYFNMAFYIGIGVSSNRIEALILTIIFLFVYFLYGMVMGYRQTKSFVKFITLYWGISAAIGLMFYSMLPIRGNPFKRAFAVIALPVIALTSFPAYGLVYFFSSTMDTQTLQLVKFIVCTLSPWVAGALGYLMGYLIKRLAHSDDFMIHRI